MTRARNLASIANTSYLTAINNNVGIGTTNPISKLDIVGSVNITGIVTATGAINSTTDVQINGVSVLTSSSNDAVALAIALG